MAVKETEFSAEVVENEARQLEEVALKAGDLAEELVGVLEKLGGGAAGSTFARHGRTVHVHVRMTRRKK